jgi:beta-lactamase superfamily II metal-dependent hydrolase
MKKKKSAVGNDAPIRIRMYRVGFGDCFLVSLPGAAGTHHILIDCGVHARGDIGTMTRVIADIQQETGGKLALVVATHRHQDHISGFAFGEETFAQISSSEVWLPWTEDPKSEKANALREKRFALAQQLRMHFAARGVERPGGDVAAILENATGVGLDGVALAGGNDRAMTVLRSGFAGDPEVKYLKAGDTAEKPGGIAGLSVRVLGPPISETYLAQMDPPKTDRYLQGAEDGAAAVDGRGKKPSLRPFPASMIARGKKGVPRLSAQDEKALVAQAASPLSGLAFALDQAINNTSLVLLMTYRGKTLLFPGDAQYGNWRFWIEKPETAALLKDVSFYKVSHHGSVNATPKRVVEALPKGGFAAMVSTQNTPWPSIPRLPLMKALEARARAVFRSDSIEIPKANKGPKLASVPKGFKTGPFWVDCSV